MTSMQHITFADLERLLTDLSTAAMDGATRAALQRARRALLQQTPPGRPRVDDNLALRQIGELTKTSGMSFNAAAQKVARALYPHENHKAIVERFRRKNKKGSTK